MYPKEGITESTDIINDHKIRNTEYTYLCDTENVKSIVDDFLDFVNIDK